MEFSGPVATVSRVKIRRCVKVGVQREPACQRLVGESRKWRSVALVLTVSDLALSTNPPVDWFGHRALLLDLVDFTLVAALHLCNPGSSPPPALFRLFPASSSRSWTQILCSTCSLVLVVSVVSQVSSVQHPWSTLISQILSCRGRESCAVHRTRSSPQRSWCLFQGQRARYSGPNTKPLVLILLLD